MNIEQFQYVNSLDSGSTTYENDLIEYFQLDQTKPIIQLRNELRIIMDDEPITNIKDKIKVNGKWYGIEKELSECSYLQNAQEDRILAEDTNVKNLHKLIAIYVRPLKTNWYGKRVIEKFKLKNQEYIANEFLKHMEAKVALGLLVFFYQLGTKSMMNINIFYLNQMKIMEKN